jgi:hypothetical protein
MQFNNPTGLLVRLRSLQETAGVLLMPSTSFPPGWRSYGVRFLIDFY